MGLDPYVKNPATDHHYAELDGIRGIAILCVLVSHAIDEMAILPNYGWCLALRRLLIPGWGGVDLFFTLSGYLITGILLRNRDSQNYFSSFYARRALRIAPVYYFALIAMLVLSHFVAYFSAALPQPSAERASYFIYLQNWPIFWSSWAGMTSIWGPYWSLAVEEQFYLLWPALVRYVSVGALLTLCVCGFLAGWPERFLMVHHLGMQFGIMQWPFSRLDGLFLGAAIAFYQNRFGRLLPLRWASVLFTTGAMLYLWVACLHFQELNGGSLSLWTTGVSAFALLSAGLVAASRHHLPWLQRFLTLSPLVVAGRYSYGMYIYHFVLYRYMSRVWSVTVDAHYPGDHPLGAIFFMVLAILLTTGVAALSFHLFESRFLALKKYFPSAPVAS